MTEVVAALIRQGEKFMICQRPSNKARGLLWEFVGGKVEAGETKEQALIRECREELDVTLAVGDVFMDVVHEYPDITVHLTLFNAAIAEGVPQKLEHNDIKWIKPDEIPNYEFCPADEEILKKIIEVSDQKEDSMNNTTRFNGKGEIYAKARPKYAAELFDYIKSAVGLPESSVIADIGSGTGIFSEQLLNSGYIVFAVEPNEDMRIKSVEKLSGYKCFTSVNGTDADTTLPDHSVDCITAAQAFHWFDTEKFRKECRRILKPNGKVIIVYNSRDENAECNMALAELHRKYSKEFHGFSNGISDEKCREFFDGNCDVFRADNSISYDRQGYINRVLSSSYSLHDGDERYAEYLADINKIFDSYAVNGVLTAPMHTVAYVGEA